MSSPGWLTAVLLAVLALCTGAVPLGAASPTTESNTPSPVTDAQRLRRLLDEVYRVMDEQYYLPVSRKAFEDFVREYPADKVRTLNERSRKTEDFVHLGAGLLVNRLKHPTDRFTNFVPPKLTKDFKQKAYAAAEDLGLEVRKASGGYEITRVQKHCQARALGLAVGDLLKLIGQTPVEALTQEEVERLLRPEAGSRVRLSGLKAGGKDAFDIELTAESYFRETVRVIPTERDSTLVLKIDHFNQKTGVDFADEIALRGPAAVERLIIDLRDNEGGPPLAAREVLGYFLPPNDPLFAIARKRQRPVLLTAPPQPLRYGGQTLVLVNERTGSAAEVLSGILQAKGIARLIGSKTAGGAYLKGVHDFEDGSMVFMVTSLTFLYDRRVFPADGIVPDSPLPPGVDALRTALSDALPS
ncbi:MAG: putative CtpA-like serine protease [Candidatus Omnitrophica bacterium]|nr:putative CtpA-like serine protease [Candidatus Omnitrophota bacterium]